MSATAVVPAPSLRNDLAAGWQHFGARLRMTATTRSRWGSRLRRRGDRRGLGVGPRHRFLHGGRAAPQRRRVLAHAAGLPRLFGSAAPGGVAVVHAPTLDHSLRRAADVDGHGGWRGWRSHRAAPGVGDAGAAVARAADRAAGPHPRRSDVAMAFVLLARAVVLAFGGLPLGRLLYGHRPWTAMHPDVQMLVLAFLPAGTPRLAALLSSDASAFESFAYASSSVVGTVLGALISFPLVLAWGTLGRVDLRGLVSRPSSSCCSSPPRARAHGSPRHGPAGLDRAVRFPSRASRPRRTGRLGSCVSTAAFPALAGCAASAASRCVVRPAAAALAVPARGRGHSFSDGARLLGQSRVLARGRPQLSST